MSSFPVFTPRLVAQKAPASTASFGDTWQEVVTRVEAFAIVAVDEILTIQNIPHDETRSSLERYVKQHSARLFVLRPGERVLRVDVQYTREVIKAIKFGTSQRVTPWFGKTNGWEYEAAIESGDGNCINALRGKYGPAGCSELCGVLMPKSIADEGHRVALPRYLTTLSISINDEVPSEYERRTFADIPRAIVVTTGENAIENIQFLSYTEYDHVAHSEESFEGGYDEHWFVMVRWERLQAISLCIGDQRIKMISFKTSLQTTHFFGAPTQGPHEWLTAPEGTYICGVKFQTAQIDGEQTITHLEALCTPDGTEHSQVSRAA